VFDEKEEAIPSVSHEAKASFKFHLRLDFRGSIRRTDAVTGSVDAIVPRPGQESRRKCASSSRRGMRSGASVGFARVVAHSRARAHAGSLIGRVPRARASELPVRGSSGGRGLVGSGAAEGLFSSCTSIRGSVISRSTGGVPGGAW
jgi:hypothetical protein